MAGRFYSTETELEERARKRNERRRALSSMFINAGIVFGASAASTIYNTRATDDVDPNVVWWILIAIVLICGSLWWVEQIEAER
jgi:predicted MFS family arabinose efflux permease